MASRWSVDTLAMDGMVVCLSAGERIRRVGAYAIMYMYVRAAQRHS